jgi:hypothetical protein
LAPTSGAKPRPARTPTPYAQTPTYDPHTAVLHARTH